MAADIQGLSRLGTCAWINAQVRGIASAAGSQPVDVQLFTTLRKLELLAEDTEAEMQATSVALVRVMPRAVVDLATLQDATAELRDVTLGLVDELQALEMQSTASLGLLVEAEHVKRRMLAVAQTLEQAQQLASTLQAAEGALARGELSAASAQLGRTAAGLAALERVPRFRDARAQVSALTSALVEQLEPRLVAALHERDVRGASDAAGALRQLGEHGAVGALFVQTRQGPLYELWNAQPRAPPTAFADWLPTFHAALADAARAEVEFAAAAGLARRRTLVATLLAQTLAALGGQCAERLIELGGGGGGAADASAVDDVVDGERARAWLYVRLDMSARAWADALSAQLRGSAVDEPPTDGPASAEATAWAEADAALRAACVAPFVRARGAYGAMERAQLAAGLRASCKLNTAGAAGAIVGALASALPAAADVLSGAPRRCAALCTGVDPAQPGTVAGAARDALPHAEQLALNAQLRDALDAAVAGLHAQLRAVLVRLRATLQLPVSSAPSEGTAGGAAHAWAHLAEAMRALTALGAHVERVRAISTATASTRDGGADGANVARRGGALRRAEEGAAAALAEARALALDCAFAPIGAQLEALPQLGVWASAGEVSAFSPPPGAYATAIGEHLLLLPHALEAHVHAAAATRLALCAAAVSTGGGDGGGDGAHAGADFEFVFAWLRLVSDRTVAELLARAASVRALTRAGAQQLGADVGYLTMAMSSGLGLEPDSRLVALEGALLAEADGKPALAALAASIDGSSTHATAGATSARDGVEAAERALPAAVLAALVAARAAGGGVGGARGGTGAGDACGGGGAAATAGSSAFAI
ncbi:hypothetical protein KFE25_005714 [Diacronema lutheri]|uniref:Conserved oligomeric Golgi complex subunit 7 n=1 Tax=Diacronema lutheri TaxID=2081491 RepID=A0A8J6C990_DIALT|nr:hypothetical protein KFE25_005714 [Diacronema lutheri]